MASPDEAVVRSKRDRKVYKLETWQCLMLARENLPADKYNKFIETMTHIWEQSADPDGEIRNISIEKCTETAMKIFEGWARVKQGFLNFTQGRSPFHDDANVLQLHNPLDFLHRVKRCPAISNDDYKALVRTLLQFTTIRTMTVEDVFHKVKRCISNCPQLLEEFIKNYLPPGLMVRLQDEQSCRSLKTSQVGKDILSFTSDANQSLDGIRMKATNRRKVCSSIRNLRYVPISEESPHAEEDEEDKVEPLPGWITSRQHELPPRVILSTCKPCTPSYYVLQDNHITLESSYRTELGRSVFNDVLVSGTSGSEESDSSERKTKNEYDETIFNCEEDMFESDMLLQWFSATADFIANLQGRVGSDMKINEHLTPLHRKCIGKLYDDYDLDALLDSQNASAALAVLLSRLNQKIEDLSEARLSVHKTRSEIIAKNYYRSLDHRGPSFKQMDTKRLSQKVLLAEAKEINKTRLDAGDEYADPGTHEDINSIISSACASEEKQLMTWTKLVQPFLSANCLWPDLKETVAPKEACEYCGISKDFLTPNALPADRLPLSSKRGEFLTKKSNDCSSSHDGFDAEIEEGEFIPDAESIKSAAMLGPGKGPASRDVAASSGDGFGSQRLVIDTCGPSTCDHGYEPEEQHKSRQDSKRTAKQRGVIGGTCCSLVMLRRLYQILYERLLITRNKCTSDLYAEFKEKLRRLLDRSIDNCNFEDFCLKFLGPESFKLFTLDILINRVIKQLCMISSSDQDNSLLQFLEKLRRPNISKDLAQRENPRRPPAQLSNGLLNHDREKQEKGSEPLDDTEKLKSRHFQRRKRRKLENGAASSSQLGGKDSNS